jgi:hypothetical protein
MNPPPLTAINAGPSPNACIKRPMADFDTDQGRHFSIRDITPSPKPKENRPK